ncbi:mitochondrial potassium channel ATP-binding subunit-like [Rhodnius prolixus]
MLCSILTGRSLRSLHDCSKKIWRLKNIHICKRSFNVTNRLSLQNTTLLLGSTGIIVLFERKHIALCDQIKNRESVRLNKAVKSELDWKRLLSILRSEIWLILGSLAAALLAAYLNVRIPLSLGDFVNVLSDVIKNSEEFLLARFKGPALRLLTLYLSQAACTFVYISLLSKMGENIAMKLKYNLFETIMKQDISFFDEIRTSTLVDCASSDVQEFKSTFKQCISQGVKSIAQITGGFFTLFVLSPTMTLSIIVVVPAIIVIGTSFGAILRTISKNAQVQSLKASTLFEEAVSNIRTVRAFANEDTECQKYKEYLSASQNLNAKLGYGIAAFQAGTNIFLNALVLGTLCLGCHLISMNNLKPGDLMSFLVATQTIERSFAHLSLLFGHVVKGKEALKRIFHYCDLTPKIPISGGIILDNDKFSPSIQFEHVTFSYPTRTKQRVLNDLNLTIPAGKTVAVVGTSGNGKTTLANLLERYYDVNYGRILISDEDIRHLDPKWLRGSVIGIISQEPVLFATSIKENIKFGKPSADDREVYEAAKLANADEFIRSFPNGYDTILGERGITISGGQKQRIAIARALIKDPAILVLDEATSALDPESEKIVQKTLEEVSRNRTVLIIAHRLTTVQNADIIVVLNKGEIVEMGSHKVLCAKRGYYWELMNKPQITKVEDNKS